MPDKPKLTDPVHFFDERGHALSSYDVLERENAALRARNERLEAMLRAVKRRAAQTGEPDLETTLTRH